MYSVLVFVESNFVVSFVAGVVPGPLCTVFW
jgi:hypothetical protein